MALDALIMEKTQKNKAVAIRDTFFTNILL